MTQATETNLEARALPPIKGVPIGTILPYGGYVSGNSIGYLYNSGWLYCNGDAVDRDDYSELFGVIGNSFGSGDRVNTFNLPDLRGMFLRGVDAGAGNDPDADSRTSKTGGHTGDNVGSMQLDGFASHTHQLTINAAHADKTGGSSKNDPIAVAGWPENRTDKNFTTDNNGGNETRPKNIYVNYIIKAKNV